MLEVIFIVILVCIVGWRILEARDEKAAEQRKIAREAAERENKEMIRKKIKAGQKYSDFCNFIDSVSAHSVAEIGEAWKFTENGPDWFGGIYVIYSHGSIKFKENTSIGAWELDNVSDYCRKNFFAINAGERRWTPEESRIVVDLVNSYIASKSSLNLERSKTRRYIPNKQTSDDVVLWVFKSPNRAATIRTPY